LIAWRILRPAVAHNSPLWFFFICLPPLSAFVRLQLKIHEKSKMTTSRIFKELNRAEIKKVISALYGSDSKIIKCSLMKGGVFNTTYLVKTDDDPNGIVLRVAPINRHLLFDFEKSMMAAEPLFYKTLQEKNIPTSEVIPTIIRLMLLTGNISFSNISKVFLGTTSQCQRM
jgi:hypothetical protein